MRVLGALLLNASELTILLIAAIATGLLGSCAGGGSEPDLPLRVYHDPYSQVDWGADLRLKGQHHDHTALNLARIRAYDEAGYHALVMMDYSGDPAKPYSLRRRLWPPEDVLPPDFVASLRNLRILLPGAEEIGARTIHVTSGFLTSYIERWDPGVAGGKQSWQFFDQNEMVAMIRDLGGLPVIAHPWFESPEYQRMSPLFGAEIYSAYAAARRREGDPQFVNTDHERLLLTNWDAALAHNQRLIGFAVNDHFGPYKDVIVDDDIRDSGKVIVLAKAATLEAYREAVERGAVLAIKDLGVAKDQYPRIESVSVEETSVLIDTDSANSVRWISHGSVIGTDHMLNFSDLPPRTRYVRAEVLNTAGSTVFTQAFWVRPEGDADGDNDVDRLDQQICDAVQNGEETDPDRVDACT